MNSSGPGYLGLSGLAGTSDQVFIEEKNKGMTLVPVGEASYSGGLQRRVHLPSLFALENICLQNRVVKSGQMESFPYRRAKKTMYSLGQILTRGHKNECPSSTAVRMRFGTRIGQRHWVPPLSGGLNRGRTPVAVPSVGC